MLDSDAIADPQATISEETLLVAEDSDLEVAIRIISRTR